MIVIFGGLALLSLVAFLPQSHELRYYMFIPLCWAAAVGIEFPAFQEMWPRCAVALLVAVLSLFLYMLSENRVHSQISRVGYPEAASYWGATLWWPLMQQGQTYCAVDMIPIGILLTGPAMSEYSIVDRSNEALCPAGTVLLTKTGIQHVENHPTGGSVPGANSSEEFLNLSLALYQAGKYDGGTAAAQEAVKLRPRFAGAFNDIFAAYIAIRRLGESIRL